MSIKIEYLNPADWSLHVVDVDNDEVGKDWIKINKDTDYLVKMGNDKLQVIRKGIDGVRSSALFGGILWQRHTQPEELPFVDDEPKGQKHDSAKPRMSLLPKGVLSSVISVLEFGAKKYKEDNWQQVSNAKTRYYDAMQRHIGAWWDGEKKDHETGEHHLAHAICCAMFLIWFDKEQSQ